MGLWRDEVAVLFVRQVTAQALPYVKPALKRPACCIIVITVTKSQAAQIKPITAHHANQLYQHGTLALLVPGLLEGTTTIGELLTHGDTGIGTGEGLDGELIILDGVAYKVGQSGVAERVPDDFTMPFANATFVPGRSFRWISALLASPISRGSTTISFAPRSTA